MTDALTDAVRRLKQLQQDVERLKAGQDEEGEPRLFITEQEQAVAADSIESEDNDIAGAETADAIDLLDLKRADLVEPETATAADTETLVDSDLDSSDTAEVSDSEAVRSVASQQALYWASGAGWETSHYTDS